MFYRDERTQAADRPRHRPRTSPTVNFAKLELGPVLQRPEVQHRRQRRRPRQQRLPGAVRPNGIDPIGKTVRIGSERFTVVGVFDKRPAPAASDRADDFVVIPYTAYQQIFGNVLTARRDLRGSVNPACSASHDRGRAARGRAATQAMREVEAIMRIRHGLKLDEPNDFDLVTQDAFLKLWDQISQATFLALVVISSIALMVGGIGVMAIMSISVTERTREIGVRKALGARRREILCPVPDRSRVPHLGRRPARHPPRQRASACSSHWLSGFPISLPWWSFAIGLGFSASVGIFFGMFPAFKASRLDPIEALRYE